MCDFLALACEPEAASSGLLRALAGRALRVEPVTNPSLLAQLPRGTAAHWLTSSGCSCELYGGERGDEHGSRRSIRSRLERRGLQGRKLHLAVRDAAQAAESRRRDHAGFRSDVVKVISGLLVAGYSVQIAYVTVAGRLDGEEFGALPTSRVVLDGGVLEAPRGAVVEVILR